jgi:hypothetical protein
MSAGCAKRYVGIVNKAGAMQVRGHGLLKAITFMQPVDLLCGFQLLTYQARRRFSCSHRELCRY